MLHQIGSEKYSRSDMFEAFIGMSDEDEDVATDHNNSPENAIEINQIVKVAKALKYSKKVIL